MTISRRDTDGVAVQIIGIAVRDASNVLTDVIGAAMRDASGTPQSWFGSLGSASPGETGSITVAPDSVYGFINSGSAATITTGSVTLSVAGATGTPVIAWEMVSSSGGTWSAVSPTSPTTAFRRLALDPGSVSDATFRALVTVDGQSAYSGDVFAQVENIGGTL